MTQRFSYKKLVRRLVLALMLLLFLCVLGVVALRMPAVQNYAIDLIVNQLSEKYDAEWQIGSIHIDFFDEITLREILLLDQAGDTLLIADLLQADIGLFSLLDKTIYLDRVSLHQGYSHIYTLDSLAGYNFDFLLPAKRPTATSQGGGWTLGLGLLDLRAVDLRYSTDSSEVHAEGIGLELAVEQLDTEQQRIVVDRLTIAGPRVTVTSTAKAADQESAFALPSIGWLLQLDRATITDVEVAMLKPRSQQTLRVEEIELSELIYDGDQAGLVIDGVAASVEDVVTVTSCAAQVDIVGSVVTLGEAHLTTSRDDLRVARATIDMSTWAAAATDLALRIDHQTLADYVDLLPPSIRLVDAADVQVSASQVDYSASSISTAGLNLSYGQVIDIVGSGRYSPKSSSPELELSLDRLSAYIPSLETMIPALVVPDSMSHLRRVTMSGLARGSSELLYLDQLSVVIDRHLELSASGILRDVASPTMRSFDLMIDRLSADVRELGLTPSASVAYDSLGRVDYVGSLAGTSTAVRLDGSIQTSLGAIGTALSLDLAGGLAAASYDGRVMLDSFDVGTLLKQSDVGRVTMDITADGVGLDPQQLDSRLSGTIRAVTYRGYTYRDINIDAIATGSVIDGTLDVDDANLGLAYSGQIDLDPDKMVLDFQAQVDTINLAVLLGLSEQLSLSGGISSSIRLPLSRGEAGYITITDLKVGNGRSTYVEDSMQIRARKTVDSTFVTMASGAIDLDVSGQFGLRDAVTAFRQLLGYHLDIDSLARLPVESRSLLVTGSIKSLAPIDVLVPERVLQTRRIDVDLAFDFVDHLIDGAIVVDSMQYGALSLASARLDFTSDTQLSVVASVAGLDVSGTPVSSVQMTNLVDRGAITTAILATDQDGLIKLKSDFGTAHKGDYWSIVAGDSLVINSRGWIVSPDNMVEIHPHHVTISDLEVSRNGELVRLSTVGTEGEDLVLGFQNFSVSEITTFLTGEPSRLSGSVDGGVELRDLAHDRYLVANVTIDDITYDSTAVGRVVVDADDNPETGIISTSVSVSGPVNDVSGVGSYDRSSGSTSFDLDMKAFELRLLDPFLTEIIRDSEGVVRGSATLRGTLEEPDIRGSVELDEVVTTIAVTQARYGIDKHTITFDNSSIQLGVLDLVDESDNVASLSGTIKHTALDNVVLDLSLATEQFTFLNTTAADNPVFYGRLYLSAEGSIKGPPSLLEVDIAAKTLPTTTVTISPFSAEQYLLDEDFVTYGKPSDFEDRTAEYLLQLSRRYPFKVNLLLDATRDAFLNFVIDPISGDMVAAHGDGDLRVKLSPDGQQEIYGTYTIVDGDYTFSYGDFVSKDFDVKQGGTVRFNGNPLSAALDIEAVYEAHTTTYELIKNEMVLTDSEVSAAQDRTTVQVVLSLEGTLTNPEIGLDIQVPQVQSTNLLNSINRKLAELRNNPNELNNQVFGLLIFNSFILSDSAPSSFGTIGSDLALSSISNLISSQLNAIAGKAIKGVDVSFNVNSYDSRFANNNAGGTVTEVGVQVSKQLFDDRLSISAGGNVDMGTSDQATTYSSFIGDFVLEYKLTRDGRYRLRVFSKTDYDRLLNENNARNGVSLFFSRAFDSKVDE